MPAEAAPASAPVKAGCIGAPARSATMSAASMGAAKSGIIRMQNIEWWPTRRASH